MRVYLNGEGDNDLIAGFDASTRERIAPYLRRVRLERSEPLVSQGALIDAVYFPIDCVTSTLLELPEGDTIEVGLMGAEGVVGLSLLYGVTSSNTTVIAQIAGTADVMPARDFEREIVVAGGDPYRRLLRYADAFTRMISQVAACNAIHRVSQRCARWILMVHDRVGRDEFALTHEYLSLMLGVRRASVSEVANALRERGAIDYDRGTVRVVDRRKLEHASCPCYAALVKTMHTVHCNGAATADACG